jgi:hypothetical protein
VAALNAAALREWTPIRVFGDVRDLTVEWAVVEQPFSDPFFEQTAGQAMQHPFNALFARRTPVAQLETLAGLSPGVAPAGFIFHMSRCGSTLIAQMLARLSHTIVLSEPQPFDALLRLRRRMDSDEQLAEWLRGLMGVLGRPRLGERRLFVKFHAWHVLELPFIARVFPNVPWIFVFREPRAVLRLQAANPGAEVVPGTIDPGYLGLDVQTAAQMPDDEYAARVIAAFCEAAMRGDARGRSLFVDYAGLPEIVFSDVATWFGIEPDEGETDRMRAAARLDAKNPARVFRPPTAQPATSADCEQLIAGRLDAAYTALRAAAARPPP